MDFKGTTPYDQLAEKWSPILDHADCAPIEDGYKRKVTACLLENQEEAMREQHLQEASPVNSAGGGLRGVNGEQRPMGGYDPILISLVRRSMPNLMAYDICGVQPMNAPTGLIFALKAQYGSNAQQTSTDRNNEALFNEVGSHGGTAGATAAAAQDPFLGYTAGDVSFKQGMSRSESEALGDYTTNPFAEMAFSIERTVVTAKTRALKAEYTTELAQDLKAVHGLDAETELANILSTEILAEINREVVRTIYGVAKLGSQQKDLSNATNTGVTNITGAVGGIYDLSNDSDGRWSAERWRGLMFQIERECNVIAKHTRRGKGNFLICDSDTASALAMGGFLNISPALNVNLNIDDTGNTFAGILNGKI
ncbi:MAG: ATP-binding protein, partial [Proteobacteria bacterium]|nr:ATP-binding protein [Pseudomonadota bacterium]